MNLSRFIMNFLVISRSNIIFNSIFCRMPAKCRINHVHLRTKLNFKTLSSSKSSLSNKSENLTSDSASSSSLRSAKLSKSYNRRGRRPNLHRNTGKRQRISRMSQKNKRIHLYMISEQYKRKMSDVV
jgi:hypothetical protein